MAGNETTNWVHLECTHCTRTLKDATHIMYDTGEDTRSNRGTYDRRARALIKRTRRFKIAVCSGPSLCHYLVHRNLSLWGLLIEISDTSS